MFDANPRSDDGSEERRRTPARLGVEVRSASARFNHVLKGTTSTHGCQHMVVNTWLTHSRSSRILVPMSTDPESLVDALIESGRRDLVAGVPEGREESLAILRFGDLLRRSADRLCHESAMAARNHGASWREVGMAVGGITPQGAEHRFSPAAKERRSKTSKRQWVGKERRAVSG